MGTRLGGHRWSQQVKTLGRKTVRLCGWALQVQGCSWRKNRKLYRSGARGTVPPSLNLGHAFGVRVMVRHHQAGSWEIVMCMQCVSSIKKEWDPARSWSSEYLSTTKPLALEQWIFFTQSSMSHWWEHLINIPNPNPYLHIDVKANRQLSTSEEDCNRKKRLTIQTKLSFQLKLDKLHEEHAHS